MLKIGLTGGIGSGKSTICNYFDLLGVPIIDTDDLAREAVKPGSVTLSTVVDEFGDTVLQNDGTLNRKKLRELVFHNKEKRKRLEEIIHPEIRHLLQQRLHDIIAPYVIIAIPLLVENQWQDSVDRVLVVDAPVELQIERTRIRDNSHDSLIQNIITAQASREDRLKLADDIIINSSDMDALKNQVSKMHQYYTHIADIQ